MKYLFADLETFSPLNLPQVGSFRYAEDCEILLWGYAIDTEPARVWDCTNPQTKEMPEALAKALKEVQAGERKIVWHNGMMFDTVVLAAHGYHIPLEMIVDTMVIAYQHGLPGALGDLCDVLRMPTDKAKDKDGKRLVQLFCKPQPECYRVRRHDRYTKPEDWIKFVNYCRLDVEAERELFKALPKWNCTEWEHRLQVLDAEINRRGVKVDIELAKAAVELSERRKGILAEETQRQTNGEVGAATQRDALIGYMAREYGWKIDTMTKAELEKRVDDPSVPEPVRELLKLRLMSTKTSIQKFKALLRRVNKDGRMRGGLQFRGAARTGRWCLTGDHEVLTPNGWVRLDEWQGGEIACWNVDETVDFMEAKALAFPYEGEMCAIESKRVSQISTPDHRMACAWGTKREWRVKTAEECALGKVRIPYYGRRKLPWFCVEEIPLRVAVMTQADGHFSSRGRVTFHFKKERKVARCQMLLSAAGIRFSRNTYETGTVFTVYPSDIPEWLRAFEEKVFSPALFDADPDVFFDELSFWDGSVSTKNSFQYSTAVRANADFVQAFAHMSGRAAILLERPGRKEGWSTIYTLNIWENGSNRSVVMPEAHSKQAFKGTVYCAETKTGFFMVRRNGRVWVTGNSGRGMQLQNLARPTVSQKEIDFATEVLKQRDGTFECFYDDPSVILPNLLRGEIIAPAGKKLIVADYSNVEGRVLAWLAGEEWKLQAFRDFDAGHGHDLYKLAYARAFGVKPEDVTKPQRQIGKVLELALGYGGGAAAFARFASGYGMNLNEMAEYVKSSAPRADWLDAADSYSFFAEKKMTGGLERETFIACETLKRLWRKSNPKIVQFWANVGQAVQKTIVSRESVRVGYVAFARTESFLVIRLPSGRLLCYPSPKTNPGVGKDSFTYMGVNQFSRKWEKIESYGAKACIAAGTPVLCRDGWTPIEDVTPQDEVWDGVEWVRQEGAVSKGAKQTLTAYGVRMTPDHKVLTTEGWRDASQSEKFSRADCRIPDGYGVCGFERASHAVEVPVRCLREDGCSEFQSTRALQERQKPSVMRMPEREIHRREDRPARHESDADMVSVALHEGALRDPDRASMEELRGPRDHSLQGVERVVREVLRGHGSDIPEGATARSNRQREGLLEGQLPMGIRSRELQQPAKDSARGREAACGLVAGNRNRYDDPVLQTGARLPEGASVRQAGRDEQVYDLVNCGPRHRFVVLGEEGPLIVHNCENITQAVACDLLSEGLLRMDAAGYKTVLTIHDEAITEAPDTDEFTFKKMEHLMSTLPDWAPGLPLVAAGYEADRYRKD